MHVTLAYHWTRMIEMQHAAEAVRDLLDAPELLAVELQAPDGTLLELLHSDAWAYGPYRHGR